VIKIGGKRDKICVPYFAFLMKKIGIILEMIK
jgi:hypothetical protein